MDSMNLTQCKMNHQMHRKTYSNHFFNAKLIDNKIKNVYIYKNCKTTSIFEFFLAISNNFFLNLMRSQKANMQSYHVNIDKKNWLVRQ